MVTQWAQRAAVQGAVQRAGQRAEGQGKGQSKGRNPYLQHTVIPSAMVLLRHDSCWCVLLMQTGSSSILFVT